MIVSSTMGWLERVWRGSPIQITVGGKDYRIGQGEPRLRIVMHDPGILRRLWLNPSLVFGEAYMAGEIELDGEIEALFRGFYLTWPTYAPSGPMALAKRISRGPRRASPRRSVANASHHYDIGNDFFKLWLDPSLTYSCAYFLDDDQGVAKAQQQKLELLCRKARLAPGQRVLDIGCGWGSLLFHAARHHGVHITGLTAAHEQATHIQSQAKAEGLDDRLEVRHGDWRDLSGQFDRIISAGMFEHVGLKQYARFFQSWAGLLAEGGLSVLHTIGRMKVEPTDPWIERYIFPGGYLPTLSQITSHAAKVDLNVMDVENLRQHYFRTLGCWAANYSAVRDQVVKMYDESFARMWWLYLQGARAAFGWGDLHLWQTILAKNASHTGAWPLNREVGLARTPSS